MGNMSATIAEPGRPRCLLLHSLTMRIANFAEAKLVSSTGQLIRPFSASPFARICLAHQVSMADFGENQRLAGGALDIKTYNDY